MGCCCDGAMQSFQKLNSRHRRCFRKTYRLAIYLRRNIDDGLERPAEIMFVVISEFLGDFLDGFVG